MKISLAILGFIAVAPAQAADLRVETIDGKEVIVFAERNDEDGGIITSTCTPDGAGAYYCYRSWEGRGIVEGDDKRDPAEVAAEKRAAQDAALDKFRALTGQDIEARAAKAIEQGVSGTLDRQGALGEE